MRTHWMTGVWVLLTASLGVPSPSRVHGQAVSVELPPEAQAARAFELARAEAESLAITINSQKLKREPLPLLRWSNPVSGQIYGDVYLWTLDGRPEVIASIYKWFSPYTHLATELQSLSESPLKMTRQGTLVWHPGKGIQMEPLPSAPQPHSNAFQRMRQMRALSNEFAAKAEDRSDVESTWTLRPLAKPIYRYKSETRGIVDGAMFAFCQGNTNNPEVLLLLEARRSDEETVWYYGLGRQNSLRFTVHRKGELIWDVPKLAPPWPAISLPDKPYMVIKTQPDLTDS